MKLAIRPLTPELWLALEDLFGEKAPAAAAGACMAGSARPIASGRARNKSAFRSSVKRGPPPGLLAFDDDLVVGWCQITPRDDVPALDRVHHLKRVDDAPV